MEKYVTDERTGLKYELIGDYYLIAGEDEPEQEPIGVPAYFVSFMVDAPFSFSVFIISEL